MNTCQLFKLSATEDYRRLSLTTAATQLLQQPLQAADSFGSSNSSSNSSSSSIAAVDRMYFWPLGPAADAAMHQLWTQHLKINPGSSGSSGSNADGWGGSSGSNAGGWGGSSGSTNPLELLATDGPYAEAPPTQRSSSDTSGSSSSSGSGFVPVMFGRSLQIPQAAGGAAWFEFEELCGKPLGSADYLALAQHYHTLFLSGGANALIHNTHARRLSFVYLHTCLHKVLHRNFPVGYCH
jgi:predicted ATPase